MSAARVSVAFAGEELVRERLAAYQRYARVVAAQGEALDRGDLESFEHLSREALDLQAGIGPLSPSELADPSYLERTAELLTTSLAHYERMQERLRSLRDQVGREVRGTFAGAPRARTYLEGVARDGRPAVDLRL